MGQIQHEPRQNVKELGQQLPDLLLGAQDFPSLIIDSLNGLKNQSAARPPVTRNSTTSFANGASATP